MIWRHSWICESRRLCCSAVSNAGVVGFRGSPCRSLGRLREGSLHRLLASRRVAQLLLSRMCGYQMWARGEAFFLGPCLETFCLSSCHACMWAGPTGRKVMPPWGGRRVAILMEVKTWPMQSDQCRVFLWFGTFDILRRYHRSQSTKLKLICWEHQILLCVMGVLICFEEKWKLYAVLKRALKRAPIEVSYGLGASILSGTLRRLIGVCEMHERSVMDFPYLFHPLENLFGNPSLKRALKN